MLKQKKREADNTQMLKQKKKEAENTILNISFFFAPVFAPIYCCIPCLPTLVFLSVMLLNFVFFGIWVKRSYQTGIQPHNVNTENTILYILFVCFLLLFLFCLMLLFYYCIPYLLTLVFLSVMLLNFVFFGIWVRRSYQS